ncbi:hypothetical protein [Micromonospora sp. WMMD1082]|uniref:hypothetical protein n=1 Tax=Micromonospora sp. WMMD1082 TaxID=3016104 RepID=UPI002417226E|nr:hypothetical protein [Micromonospora sp. WMMD1082]MDG4796234.1 hypothetical protein [Micromonospora sp. WMMD1082]
MTEQAYLTVLAEGVERQHADGGTCDHCTDAGCQLLTSAQELLDAYRLADEAVDELGKLWARAPLSTG